MGSFRRERHGSGKKKRDLGIKHLPDDFDSRKSQYLKRIDTVVAEHKIRDSLIINWDQTDLNYIPVNPWTMEEKVSKQVPIAQLDDKRQMNVLLACTKSGDMLSLIYQGMTDACHPTYPFPEGWDITHTDTHWSTSESMPRYVYIFNFYRYLFTCPSYPLLSLNTGVKLDENFNQMDILSR